MAKHSNSRSSAASPQRPRADQAWRKPAMPGCKPSGQAPAKIGPNSSSRADGLWLGAPRPAILTAPMSAVGRFGRCMPRTGDYPW